MFNKNSLNKLKGNNRSSESLAEVVHKTPEKTSYMIKKQDSKFLLDLSLQSIRYGMLLAHQGRMRKQAQLMIKNLYIKNFGDEEVDMDKIAMHEMEDLVDKDSGKHFGTIIHEQMIDDWANDPNTETSLDILEGLVDGVEDPSEFFAFMNETAEKMAECYRAALKMNTISNSIN